MPSEKGDALSSNTSVAGALLYLHLSCSCAICMHCSVVQLLSHISPFRDITCYCMHSKHQCCCIFSGCSGMRTSHCWPQLQHQAQSVHTATVHPPAQHSHIQRCNWSPLNQPWPFSHCLEHVLYPCIAPRRCYLFVHVCSAPVKPKTPYGEMLQYYLRMEPQLFRAAVDQQLARMKEEKDAKEAASPSDNEAADEAGKQRSKSELVLYQRMEELRAMEVRATLEDLMYVSILEKFVLLQVEMLPRLDGEQQF